MRYAGGGVGHYKIDPNDVHKPESDPNAETTGDEELIPKSESAEVQMGDRELGADPPRESIPEALPPSANQQEDSNGPIPLQTEIDAPTFQADIGAPRQAEIDVPPQDEIDGRAEAEIDEDVELEGNPDSDSEDSSEDGEGGDGDDNLPEDGEGGFVDAEDEEGFAEL